VKIVLSRISDALSALREFARREPVLTRAAVAYVVPLAAGLGLQLDADQILGLLGLSTAASYVLARRKVTPMVDMADHA